MTSTQTRKNRDAEPRCATNRRNVHGRFTRTPEAPPLGTLMSKSKWGYAPGCRYCLYVGPHQDYDLFVCTEYEVATVYDLVAHEREDFGFGQVLNRAASAEPGSSLHRAVVAYRLAKQQGLLEPGPPRADDDIPY